MQWLDKCIKSIENQSHVIIVDNRSTDGTIDFIENNFPEVILLKQSGNLGFGKANNIGLTYALNNGGDFVFLINQDVYVEKNVVEQLVLLTTKNPDYGIISPMHLKGKGKGLDTYFSFCASKNNQYRMDAVRKQFSQIYSVPMVNGAAWFMPIKAVKEIGGFDPIFYHYGEDHNYCQRLLYHNFKIGIAPTLRIRHDRESRIKTSINLFSNAYYKKYEKQLKVNYADINSDLLNNCSSIQKTKYIKLMIKSILVLNFEYLRGYYKQYKSITPIFQSIYKSRGITKQLGNHYLK
jgi:GT2 family glycosyltransferase